MGPPLLALERKAPPPLMKTAAAGAPGHRPALAAASTVTEPAPITRPAS